MQTSPPITDPKVALRTARILTAALLAGLVLFLLVIAFVIIPGKGPAADTRAADILHYIALGMLVLAVIVSPLLRKHAFRKGTVAGAVSPQAYVTGTILSFNLWEGVALLSLVNTMLAGQYWPYVAPAVAAMLLFIIQWPDGRPMHPGRAADGSATEP